MKEEAGNIAYRIHSIAFIEDIDFNDVKLSTVKFFYLN